MKPMTNLFFNRMGVAAVWTGLSDPHGIVNYHFYDGTVPEWAAWDPSELLQASKCVQHGSTGWKDRRCTQTKSVVCQKGEENHRSIYHPSRRKLITVVGLLPKHCFSPGCLPNPARYNSGAHIRPARYNSGVSNSSGK